MDTRFTGKTIVGLLAMGFHTSHVDAEFIHFGDHHVKVIFMKHGTFVHVHDKHDRRVSSDNLAIHRVLTVANLAVNHVEKFYHLYSANQDGVEAAMRKEVAAMVYDGKSYRAPDYLTVDDGGDYDGVPCHKLPTDHPMYCPF